MKTLKKLSILGLVVLILNIIWEFSHSFLYIMPKSIDMSEISQYPHLIAASFGDMLIILCIFTIVSLKNRNFTWIKSPSKFDYLLIVFLCLAIAVFIEVINLNLGRWAYTAAMPTIFGIGISPLIQLASTGVISLIILSYIENNKYTAPHP